MKPQGWIECAGHHQSS